jgi:type III secretion system low calcium response chaperone LcrH/SycD
MEFTQSLQSKLIAAMPAQVSALLEQMLAGHTLGGLMGLSVEEQNARYALAVNFYRQGKYPEAVRLFGSLLLADHFDRRYYMGFAACLQMQQRHADALKYYSVASALDLTDPVAVMHCAQCQLALGDRAQAQKALGYALTQARGHERHHHHVARLEAMAALIASGPAIAAGTPVPNSTPTPTAKEPS